MHEGIPQINRTPEIEELSNRVFIHPLSRLFVRLFRFLGVHPNAVSILGLLCGFAGAVCYYNYQDRGLVILGFAFMIGWHVFDGADGQLARLTGRTSELGEIIDGVCDHLANIVVYVAMAWSLSFDTGHWTWIPAWAAGLSHIVQASAYEFQRRGYDYYGHGKVSAGIPSIAHIRLQFKDARGLRRLLGQLYIAYVRVQHQVTGHDEATRERLTALHENPVTRDVLQSIYRDENVKNLKYWSFLSANNRTILVFLSCYAGSPLYYFLFEAIAMNLALAGLIRAQRQWDKRLWARLKGNYPDMPEFFTKATG